MEEINKTTLIVLFLIFLIGFILSLPFIIFYFNVLYPAERDIWSKLDKAQTFAEAEYMLQYINEAVSGLESRGWIKGNCAILFPKPDNDLEVQYKTLLNIKQRLQRTITFDKNSVEYQTAVDDIRGTIREVSHLQCPVLSWWRK